MASAGVVAFIIKGDWISGSNYTIYNLVYYAGSTYVAKTDITNSTIDPVTDTGNWQLFAHGYIADTLSAINATDTSGLIGTAGETVSSQALMDKIADMVADKLILKTAISNQQINDPNKVAGNALVYSIGQDITTLNSNLNPSSANATLVLNPTSVTVGNTIDMDETLINTYRGFEIITSFEGGAYPARQYVPSGIIKIGGTYGLSLIQSTSYFGYVQFSISTIGVTIDNIIQNGWTNALSVSIYGIDKIN